MQTDFSIYMGMVLTYLPLMILPLYAVMVRLMTKQEAATVVRIICWSLVQLFCRHIAGDHCRQSFSVHPAAGEFVIPAFLVDQIN